MSSTHENTPGVRRSWWRLLHTLRSTGDADPLAWRFGLAVLLGVLATACAVGLSAAAAWLIARAAEQPPILTLMVAIVGVRAFGLGRGVFRYLERLLAHDAALRFLAGLRVRLYRRLEPSVPGHVIGERSGAADLRDRLVRDVDGVLDVVLRLVLPAVAMLVVAGGTAILAAVLLPAAGVLVSCCVVAAVVGVPWVTRIAARDGDRRIVPARVGLTLGADELVATAPELIAYGAERRALEDVEAADRELRRVELRSAWSVGLGAGLVTAAVGAAVWGSLALGAPATLSGDLPAVALAVLVLTPLALADVLAGLPAMAGIAVRARDSLSRLTELFDAPVEDAPVRSGVVEAPYDVRVRGLAARWSTPGPDAFSDVSFDLQPGRRVALVGPSGSGKSTLAQVLVGFLPPARGDVRIAGVSLTDLPGERIRAIVGLCTQSAYVFDTTLAENVRLARPTATDDEVRDVLARVGLLDFVDSLPDGPDTRVGEHGGRLSGGERQRLALARCLLADTPVVVLDEPTEHLDEATARRVTSDLLAATAGRGVLLVTHRSSDLELVDDVVRLGPPAGPPSAPGHRAR